VIEPLPDHHADGADVHGGGAHRHQQVYEIKLPKLGDDGEQRHRAAEAASAGQHHRAGAELCDGIADEHHQRRGEQVEAGDGGGNQRVRPAMQPVQLGEIDAVAVEAEAPAEHRRQIAGQHHAPAGVAP
jgi:hypothetical protein